MATVRFERDMQLLRDNAADLISAELLAAFGPERAARYTEAHNGSADARWVAKRRRRGAPALPRGNLRSRLHRRPHQDASRIMAKLIERFADDSELLQQCASAFVRINAFESEIILAQSGDARDHRRRRASTAAKGAISSAGLPSWSALSTEQSTALTDRTRSTAASARGMLGKTSEVAAAAEQSAVAMREAAQTAAGLIRAIEDARSEVEIAAGVATRAGDQASRP